MATSFDHTKVEEKWQAFWEDRQLFQDSIRQQSNPKNPLYLLFAFAYPSGSGLHVGHVESKTALDILARYYRMSGREVFFPVGWDAFGLPAENYAIKTGVPPVKTTKDAINTFRRQLKRIGISYDWTNEIATCHPGYYKWTQWIFLQLYSKGLAYQADGKVNWCPQDQTVLANEQVVNGECERCGTQVIQKDLKQWYFKITKYQEELISGLDQVDWPTPTKLQQLNWIGKSEGIQIAFDVVDSTEKIEVFTTAPTNWGASFLVLSPEHKAVKTLTKPEQKKEVEKYLKEVEKKSDSDRLKIKEKTGVFTGSYAVNHVNGQHIPIWIGDFVLAHVGTGALQACPGHDLRDFEFAKKFDLPIPRVVVGPDGDTSPIERPEQVIDKTMPGTMVNSDFLDGLSYTEALHKTMDYFEEKGWGKRVTTYKLRDWLISRQRYWGAPIPVVYDPEGKAHPVREEHLPWLLPTDVEFKPTGESPLVHSKEFVERTERLYGKGWRPEFDTMDTFVDSSWYFMRYVDSRNEEVFASEENLKKWLPVDFYMIGPEHIVLHLLYSRFFTKFLRDEGYVNFDEPFMKMRHQGMILGPDGRKMSKSKGNVINPDEIVEKFGADTLRVYEMFMGPIESDKPWDVSAVAGVYRFLNRIHKLVVGQDENANSDPVVQRKLHQTIKKISNDIPELKFNTGIAAMMELVNVWEKAFKKNKKSGLNQTEMMVFVQVLAPFAPFLAEELYHHLKSDSGREVDSVHLTSWPSWNEGLTQEESVTMAIQVNGKVRAQLNIEASAASDETAVKTAALASPGVQAWVKDAKIAKVIFVPGRIMNIVTVSV
jgi:leucyl-tRNA synthetase